MVIAFIPLRGGSKSIPLKNIKNLNGRPLASYCIEASVVSRCIDEVIVATDSVEIINFINEKKYPKVKIYRRDEANAQDESSTESVMLEYLEKGFSNEDDLFILVQATNPFITSEHLDDAIESVHNNFCDSLLSVVHFKRFLWSKDGASLNYNYSNRPRRQDFEGNYLENGAFYINSVGNIKKHKNRLSGKIGYYVMPEYSSYEIDEPADWFVVESILQKIERDSFANNKSKIKLLLTDVDGVLTDAGMYYSSNGEEFKKFNTRDGMGISRLKKTGIEVGIITSESTSIVANRAKKLGINIVLQGVLSKLEEASLLCDSLGIDLQNEVAFIGDDLNDYELLKAVRIKACPRNADSAIKQIPGILHLSINGGEGCVREFIDKHII